ncbi:MAG: hypothetical protein ACSLE0_06705 [Chitinophagaceae bacterium]
MKNKTFMIIVFALCATSCKKETLRHVDNTYKPEVNNAKFIQSLKITNPYFPVTAGKKYIYEGQTQDGLERIEEQRLTSTKIILGIPCIIVNFKAFLNGTLIEEAWDWYAQDNEGNVWYFGEDVNNYNSNGSLKDHAGSWQAGVDGAQPGTIMPANVKKGMAYREEYYFNHAEDRAEIIETGLTVTTPMGIFTNCIQTRNWTELEPDLNENKFYAPGIGLIKEVNVSDNTEIVLLEIQ